jgi:hypothetical protein
MTNFLIIHKNLQIKKRRKIELKWTKKVNIPTKYKWPINIQNAFDIVQVKETPNSIHQIGKVFKF